MMPATCWDPADSSGLSYQVMEGFSDDDAVNAGRSRVTSIIIDSAAIRILPNSAVTLDSALVQGRYIVLPRDSSWRQAVRTYARTGPNACQLP